ncbi:MAG: hypothetical protein JNL70_23615 [Saprospiraceae bacterium]|nr:hypothetical protein [Saprospiraceae bacterium]
MKELNLENINEKFKTCFTSHFTGMMLECCVVCLSSQNHKTGVFLKYEPTQSNIVEQDYMISWQLAFTNVLQNTHTDVNRTTDYGAMCLSLLLADTLLPEKGVWQTSRSGQGVDFWLINPLTLQSILRIEISGIRKQATTNTMSARAKKKMIQTDQSDNSAATAYVSIIEFSQPSALFLQK